MPQLVKKKFAILSAIKKIKFTIRKEPSANDIIFSIKKLIGNSNSTERMYHKIDNELKKFDNETNTLKRTIQGTSTGVIAGKTGHRRVNKKPKVLSR